MTRTVAPFLRGRTWWARVPRIGAPAVQRSLGVTDEAEAKEVCRFLNWLRGRGARSAYLLDRLASGDLLILDAYRAYIENRLDAFEEEARNGANDPDLEPYVWRWIKELERRKKPNAQTRGKYLRQVRTLLVDGVPFRRSQFTKQNVRDWLGRLPVGQPNRYRAALSSFAEYLVFDDVLPVNVVRQVPQAAERAPRTTHLSPDDAERLVLALSGSQRALHALMIATGMELGAALALRRRDVIASYPAQVYARGTKRAWRERTCLIYERWTDFFEQHVGSWLIGRALTLDAPVFSDESPWGSYRALKSALRTPALSDLPQDYRVHDHRHTWAVQAVRDGLALHTIAYQLGHRDATMVLKVYGRYQPQRSDFDRNVTTAATAPSARASKLSR